MPTNAKTGNEYTLSNADTLSHVKSARGYPENKWLTFLQARELGKKIKKGEHGVRINRVVVLDGETNTAGNDKKIVKQYTVFNVAQVEDY